MLNYFYSEFNNDKINNSNISKKENHYCYEAIAAGLDEDEINVYVKNKFLHVETKQNKKQTLTSVFKEKIFLGNIIDFNNITSSLNRGILKIKMPIKKEDAIKIKIN